tara:strand:- start:15174 stop:15443 length:270 start_codon:yes stop_codon:yes gene_type:complete
VRGFGHEFGCEGEEKFDNKWCPECVGRLYCIIRKRGGGEKKVIIKGGFNYQEKIMEGESFLIISALYYTLYIISYYLKAYAYRDSLGVR